MLSSGFDPNNHEPLPPPVYPAVAWDPSGAVFAIAEGNNTVKMFARAKFKAGPFKAFRVGDESR